MDAGKVAFREQPIASRRRAERLARRILWMGAQPVAQPARRLAQACRGLGEGEEGGHDHQRRSSGE